MKYRLICIDMDGTLLNDQNQVPMANQEALREAYNQGVTIAITTGRHLRNASMFGEMIGVPGPVIAANGAQIGVLDREEPLINQCMTKEALVKFYDKAKHYDLSLFCMTEWGVVTNVHLPEDHHYKVHNNKTPEASRLIIKEDLDLYEAFEVFDGEIIKVLCVEEVDTEKLTKLRQELEREGCFEIVSSWHNNIEVMSPGISKGEGVRRLADYLAIPREQIMCIGDSENDLSMIQYAGLGVAMGNATEQIKAAADYITATNLEAGVAQAVRHFVLEANQ